MSDMMVMRAVATVGLTLLALCSIGPAARSEISPEHQRRAEDHAPEVVMIRVINLYAWCRREDCSFDVRAEVLCNLRSATGLTRGDRIRIQYASDFEKLGSHAPRVTEAKVYPAFLRENQGWCVVLLPNEVMP